VKSGRVWQAATLISVASTANVSKLGVIVQVADGSDFSSDDVGHRKSISKSSTHDAADLPFMDKCRATSEVFSRSDNVWILDPLLCAGSSSMKCA